MRWPTQRHPKNSPSDVGIIDHPMHIRSQVYFKDCKNKLLKQQAPPNRLAQGLARESAWEFAWPFSSCSCLLICLCPSTYGWGFPHARVSLPSPSLIPPGHWMGGTRKERSWVQHDKTSNTKTTMIHGCFLPKHHQPVQSWHQRRNKKERSWAAPQGR